MTAADSRSAGPPPSARRVLGLSMLAVFATTMFFRAVDPVVPQIADHFLVDSGTVALLATAFSLPYARMQPVLAGVADCFGKSRVMTWSLLVQVILAAIAAAAPNFSVLFASRISSG